MLLIQSSDSDASTCDVLDWLRFLKPEQQVVLVNDEAKIGRVSHRISNASGSVDLETMEGVRINTNQLFSRWYRRGYLELANVPPDNTNRETWQFSMAAREFVSRENEDIENSLDRSLANLAKTINKFADNNTNKLINLTTAATLQIAVPDTLVTNDVDELASFQQIHGRIITKALVRNFFQVQLNNQASVRVSLDTTIVTGSDIEQLRVHVNGSVPLPALFQEYIEKAFELRIFVLYDKLYAMAIFSQANEFTKVDFRNYDLDRPNRCVPYLLPGDIAAKLTALMNELQLNSGSIDMIVTPNGDHVFLEVNPVGKYQWLRHNCNFDIDRTIASHIVNR